MNQTGLATQPGIQLGAIGVTRPSSFSPLDLSPVLWLDFSDAATLFTDAAKTTPVTSDGDVIGAAADKSGFGNDATQAVTADKSLYKTPIQNGLSVARFDGISDYLAAVDSDSLSLTTSMTAFAVWTPSNTDANEHIFAKANNDGLNVSYDMIKASVQRLKNRTATGSAFSDAFTNTNHWTNGTPIISSYINNDKAFQWYKNGTADGSKTQTVALTDIPSTPLYVGRSGSAAGTYKLTGDIMEIFIFSAALSDENRILVEAYLNDKWAVY